MRFRTNEADGLLLFADGNQGDYLIMSLVRGELYLHLDLGELLCVIDIVIAYSNCAHTVLYTYVGSIALLGIQNCAMNGDYSNY